MISYCAYNYFIRWHANWTDLYIVKFQLSHIRVYDNQKLGYRLLPIHTFHNDILVTCDCNFFNYEYFRWFLMYLLWLFGFWNIIYKKCTPEFCSVKWLYLQIFPFVLLIVYSYMSGKLVHFLFEWYHTHYKIFNGVYYGLQCKMILTLLHFFSLKTKCERGCVTQSFSISHTVNILYCV